jgi:hypothetical protein
MSILLYQNDKAVKKKKYLHYKFLYYLCSCEVYVDDYSLLTYIYRADQDKNIKNNVQ